jgi:hypothetical protein
MVLLHRPSKARLSAVTLISRLSPLALSLPLLQTHIVHWPQELFRHLRPHPFLPFPFRRKIAVTIVQTPLATSGGGGVTWQVRLIH